jgi:HD-GYP domain-containing protein (c-di-GMP phosphodiesterase class II)
VEEGARYHHERFDGKGYPEGLSGNDIPLIARMICVADSFDAMNTDRVYRKKLRKDRIISELEENKGKQFDPQIAEIMLKFVRNGEVPVTD